MQAIVDKPIGGHIIIRLFNKCWKLKRWVQVQNFDL